MASKSSQNSSAESEHDGWSNRTKIILGLLAFVAFIAAYLIAVYWLPRWWAGLIGSVVNGRTSFGALLGGAVGFIFSLIPILAFLAGLRMRKTWKGIIGSFVVAVLLALPNILTLGVRFGTGTAADSARTTLFGAPGQNGAPGFTVGTYIGIAIGIAVGIWTAWITYSRRRAKRKAEALEREHTAKLDSMAEDHTSARDSHADAPSAGSNDNDTTVAGSHSGANESTDDASTDGSDDDTTNGSNDDTTNGSNDGASDTYDEITDDDTRS